VADEQILGSEARKVEPRCQHCLAQPLNFTESTVPTQSGSVYKIAWCSSCGTILAFQYVGEQKLNLPDLNPLAIRSRRM
jgi:hypothetical protein